ncbi:type II toxin-antitoxin system death-on-curing family toxin [Polynucleobacter paneuropaeus]|uniref:type II toxin-antitoxin system death-on-curing family toxin n=1 Tax=Polynucleobacter paneuropaeus TaxID=2527775 RepID=UPI001BFD9216|nr:type II toxin-antitoxin system death-on-curing family toxin [Polynucleobacter paneuropaeus]
MLQLVVLNVEQVHHIHDHIIGKHELQGLAKDKSLDAVLERVHNRLRYGFIGDVFDLASCYATFIAKGHCFNDANKRTAAAALYFILEANGTHIEFTDLSLGRLIVDVATDQITEVELAAWLRSQVSAVK